MNNKNQFGSTKEKETIKQLFDPRLRARKVLRKGNALGAEESGAIKGRSKGRWSREPTTMQAKPTRHRIQLEPALRSQRYVAKTMKTGLEKVMFVATRRRNATVDRISPS